MGSLFATVSSLELRAASGTQWKTQLSLSTWICSECRSRRSSRRAQHTEAHGQRLGVGGDMLGLYKKPRNFRKSLATVKGEETKPQSPEESNRPILKRQFERLPQAPGENAFAEFYDLKPEHLRFWVPELKAGLAQRDFHRVMGALDAANNDKRFFQDMPATTITEIFRVLQPQHMLAAYQIAYRDLSDETAEKMGRIPVEAISTSYMRSLRKLVNQLRGVGKELRLADYRVLLQAAHTCAAGDTADLIWGELKQSGLIPDVACYNAHLGAICWNGLHSAASRHKFRVTPYNLNKRRRARLDPEFANHRVKQGGVKTTVMAIFNDMQRQGVSGTEETFRHVMVALSREADMAGVKATLLKIFDIDVDAIMDDNAAPYIEGKPKLSPASPLWPSEKLLYTIAHVFGTNNDIPTALRLVDVVSRYYSLTVTPETWREMLYWTFVLAFPRSRLFQRQWAEDVGNLPTGSVNRIYTTMINEPYNVQPTMDTIKMLMSHSRHCGEWDLMRVYKRRADAMGIDSRYAVQDAHQRLEEAEERQMLGIESRKEIAERRAELEAKMLVHRRHLRAMRGFVHMLLGKRDTQIPVDYDGQFETRDIPDILYESRFNPPLVRYKVLDGIVELEFATKEEREEWVNKGYNLNKKFGGDFEITREGRLVDIHAFRNNSIEDVQERMGMVRYTIQEPRRQTLEDRK
ncbi:MAG: hypothetical protein M1820_001942 [Bogoriella megaspora]|nr:MAG: hypothetical protein M1820_001942 [Bogoriella megaspora]